MSLCTRMLCLVSFWGVFWRIIAVIAGLKFFRVFLCQPGRVNHFDYSYRQSTIGLIYKNVGSRHASYVRLTLKMTAVLHKNDWQKQNSKGQTYFAEKCCQIYETAETLWNVSSDNNWKHPFFFLCVYVHGWPKNRFSFWVAIIEVSFDRSTSVLKDFPLSTPARLHCTPLHVRFFFWWVCCLLSTVCHFRVYIVWHPCDSKNKKAPISTYKSSLISMHAFP